MTATYGETITLACIDVQATINHLPPSEQVLVLQMMLHMHMQSAVKQLFDPPLDKAA